MNGKFVAYYRVSTTKQGINGLGMDAQKDAIQKFLNGGDWHLVAEFSEVESGKQTNRPQMQKAIELCRKEKATLLIAKLDRLSRNAAFLLNLQESGIKFIAADMPHADNFTVGILAMVAQKERELISVRTRAGLAAAKRRGTKLGNPKPARAIKMAVRRNGELADTFAKDIQGTIKEIRKAGMTSLRKIAHCLNVRGFKTRNGNMFKAQTVKNLVARASEA